MLKTYIDRIEDNWYQYESGWNKLTLLQKKFLIGFRFFIEVLYQLTLNTSVIAYSLSILIPLFYIVAAPFGVVFTGIQLFPEHYCCQHSNLFVNIKRGCQGIIQAAKVAGMLFVINNVLRVTYNNFYKMQIPFMAIGFISGLITAINTVLNYQEPDPKKISTVGHDVAKLRKEIINIKEGLLKDVGNKDAHNIPVAMHDKSEIDPVTEHLSSKNKHTASKGSLWNSLCCFWSSSNSHEDAKGLHESRDLREVGNFQNA